MRVAFLLVVVFQAGCDLQGWLALTSSQLTPGIVVLPPSAITPFAPTAAGPATGTSTPCTPAANLPTYTVQTGDTLSGIAQRGGTTAAVLLAANCLTDANHITVGQALRVPAAIATAPPTTSPTVAPTAPSTGIVINSFTAAPQTSAAGATVTLTWSVSGAPNVALYRRMTDGDQDIVGEGLPATGTFTDTIPVTARDRVTYVLIPVPLPPRGPFAEVVVELEPLAGQDVEIVAFSADGSAAEPGNVLTFFWDVRGATSVSLRVVLPDGRFGPFFNGLPSQGFQSYTFPDGITGTYAFLLVPLPENTDNPVGQVNVTVAPAETPAA